MELRFFAATTIAVLSIAAGPAATGQSIHPENAQPAPAVSDAELKSFAVAVVEVKRVTDVYLPKLQTAATTEEKQQVEERASTEMKRVVENKGMTVNRFNEILAHARIDPRLADRIRRHIREPQ